MLLSTALIPDITPRRDMGTDEASAYKTVNTVVPHGATAKAKPTSSETTAVNIRPCLSATDRFWFDSSTAPKPRDVVIEKAATLLNAPAA